MDGWIKVVMYIWIIEAMDGTAWRNGFTPKTMAIHQRGSRCLPYESVIVW